MIGGLVAVAIWVIFLIAYVKIISRAGYSGWWVLVMFVPILNIVMLLVFAFKEWPIQRELAELRGWANQIQRGQQGWRPAGLGQQGPGYGQQGSAGRRATRARVDRPVARSADLATVALSRAAGSRRSRCRGRSHRARPTTAPRRR